MNDQKPSHVTATTLDNDSTADVKVATKRTVTYVFNVASAASISIPYAVQINGKVPSLFKDRPKRVSGKRGSIVVEGVAPGAAVALFLNSDAHPKYRKNPVYQITPADRDVTVTITEKLGKHSATDALTRAADIADGGRTTEHYTGVLTGDIWMRISHRYSSDEVDQLIPDGTSQPVAAAIRKIYEVLTSPLLTVETTLQDEPGTKVVLLRFTDGVNPKANISSGYDLLREGLTRVHPAGYAALLNAAIAAGIDELTLTSAWRPMLGSIAHRAGLGLDVSHVSRTPLNRKSLVTPGVASNGNVSKDEVTYYKAMLNAREQRKASQKKLAEARSQLALANNIATPRPILQRNLKNAEADDEASRDLLKQAEAAWNMERSRLEPEGVREFRNQLIKCKSVSQVFDPWFMDENLKDRVPGSSNKQLTKNESLHADHLHITIYEPQIL